MLVYDKNIFGSKRELDDVNGYLRVEACNITKSTVNPYLGKEIPNYEDLKLEPNKIYYVLRPEEELKKAIPTFRNLPLLRKHVEVDVVDVPKSDIVGSLGDNPEWDAPYVKNSLIVYDKQEIDLIESGKKKELSCGYHYTPVKEEGVYDGQRYDFRMTDIVGNHVALVKEGRAGHDVMVADSNFNIKGALINMFKKKEEKDVEVKEDKCVADKVTDLLKDEVSEEVLQDILSKIGKKSEKEEAKEEEVVEDKKETKAEKEKFAEGVEYGEEKEKSEPKKLDEEHEEEGEKKADEKKEDAKKEMAKDSALAMDEVIKMAKDEMIAEFGKRDVARKAVRSFVGDVDIMAFDSAEDIYKFACEQAGMNCNEIVSFKDAFAGLSMAKQQKLTMDAVPVSDGLSECVKDIRLA